MDRTREETGLPGAKKNLLTNLAISSLKKVQFLKIEKGTKRPNFQNIFVKKRNRKILVS